MNLNSKYFDRIRIKPDGAAAEGRQWPACEWHGCHQLGTHRAPKGRQHEGEYLHFCLDHVREYNKSYNYFAGMGDDDVAAYQRSATTGHRPTWTMGVKNGGAAEASESARKHFSWGEPLSIRSASLAAQSSAVAPKPEPERRPLKNLERRSFAALDLEGREDASEIKTRYKILVKRLHPDANGGDRSSEDRLRQIIQAYHYLKSAGFC